MKLVEFKDEIVKRVAEHFDPEYKFRTENVVKNNGIELLGLTILSGKTNVEPCIYLNSFYENFMEGRATMEDAVEEIIQIYEDHKKTGDFDDTVFTVYEKASDNIRGRLINAEKNEKVLAGIPHRRILDLALVYVIELPEKTIEGVLSAKITNKMLKIWNLSEEDMYLQMQLNMSRMNEGTILNMATVIKELMDVQGMCDNAPELPDEKTNMFVLSNKDKINGAVELLSNEMLEKAGNLIGNDFYIIPSSIHETILISAEDKAISAERLADMVRDVNVSAVSENEILSYHVYHYSIATGEMTIAA